MLYTTLKANKENEIDYIDIAYYTDENWRLVADLFENSEKYYWNNCDDHTDFDKLYKDYTERQVASACLKHLKERCKGQNPPLMIWEGRFIDLDCDGEIAYDQMEELIEDGTITGSNQLREIEKMAERKGTTIKKGYRYGENDMYYGRHYISDLIDKHFPCYAEMNDDYCNNCGNCQ